MDGRLGESACETHLLRPLPTSHPHQRRLHLSVNGESPTRSYTETWS
jgi:hypothetical protein